MSSRLRAGRGHVLQVGKRRGATAGVLAAGVAIGGLLSACSGGAASSGGAAPASTAAPPSNVITVSATACGTGWAHPAAGTQTLYIRNTSRGVIEVQLIDPENGAVYAQLEGVGAGTTRSMPVDVGSGQYSFSCSGTNYGARTGPVIQVQGQVRGGGAILPLTQAQLNTVTDQAHAYVASGLGTLVQQTGALSADIQAGNLASARTMWLTAHLTWERLGSAYGMFGGYDDSIDGLPDGLPGGVRDPGFTGFYRLEYGLWHGQSASELAQPARQLATDARSLTTAWPGLELPPGHAVGDLALRTHEVLENAVQFQLSGHDDFGSGTTLATFAAGIDATRAQLAILNPLLVSRYPQTAELYRWLSRLEGLVDAAKTSHGWTPAGDLTTAQREQLDATAGQTVELLAPIPVIFEQERPVP